MNTITSGMNSAMPAVPVANSPDELLNRLGGQYTTKTITLAGGAGAKVYDCFTIAGVVEFLGLYGVFLTAANTTTASQVSFQWYDGAAVADLTASDPNGIDCSGAVAGSLISKKSDITVAAGFANASVGGIVEDGRNYWNSIFKCFAIVAKAAATNKIQFEVTQDAATAATIKIVALWYPLSATGSVVAS